MIRHVWSVVCSKASIDNDTNNISLFEVLEQVQVSQWPQDVPQDAVPLAPFPMEIVTLWMREPLNEPQSGECRAIVHSPRGKSAVSAAQVMDLAKFRRFRSRFRFPGLPIDGPGICEIEIQYRRGSEDSWEVVGKVPIEITSPESG